MVHLRSVQLANGETLGYREREDGDHVLLLVHGNMSTSQHWDVLMEKIDSRFRVIAVDQRGFGTSTYNQRIHSLKDFAEDLKQFTDVLGLKKFSLMGWSMGGGVAMQFAANYPDQVDKLILLASASTRGYPIYSYDEKGQPIKRLETREEIEKDPLRAQPIEAAYRNRDKDFLRNLWDTMIYFHKKPDEKRYDIYLEEIMTQRNLVDVYHALNIFNISDHHNGLVQGTGEVHKITMPVLLIQGKNDLLVTEKMANEILEDIGENARMVLLEQCGHSPQVEQLDRLVEEVENFLR